jgi:hypothetical protein
MFGVRVLDNAPVCDDLCCEWVKVSFPPSLGMLSHNYDALGRSSR